MTTITFQSFGTMYVMKDNYTSVTGNGFNTRRLFDMNVPCVRSINVLYSFLLKGVQDMK